MHHFDELAAARARRAHMAFALLFLTLCAGPACAVDMASDLAHLSLEELGNLEITSVSKSAQELRSAPASIYVITRDEILRSGATSIPEALRLAPNLEVRQFDAKNYLAAARGMSGNLAAQNFSNKLLILIDGRSVYSPLFSGIYYDAQDVFLEDIDRVEVISGPGATLWGANAVNGVINIITRSAIQSMGGVVSAGGGNLERRASGRFGGSIGENASYRVYGLGFEREALRLPSSASAEDDWRKGQVGARLDWSKGNHTLTAQADAYKALQNQLGPLDLAVLGANALLRWQRHAERSDLQVQAYFDDTERVEDEGGLAFVMHTYDFEVQQVLDIGSAQRLIVGGGERLNKYGIRNGSSLLFIPSERTLHIGNVFAQDAIDLSERWQLTVGIKLEENPFAGWEVLPDARLAWRLDQNQMLWASAARAIRSPTPFDVDVVERVGGVDILRGNPNFEPERVDAYEVGWRAQPREELSFSISAFYNRYDDLRTVESTSNAAVPPFFWANEMRGETYGVEAWAKWQVFDWWRIAPGFRYVREHLDFKPGASGLIGPSQAGNDPRSQALLNSQLTLGMPNLTFDVLVRYSAALPDPALDAYCEVNARLGWILSDGFDVSLSGSNLLHDHHREGPGPVDAELRRGVLAEARWRF